MIRLQRAAIWLRTILLVIASAVVAGSGQAEPRIEPDVVYGEAGGQKLLVDVYRPADQAADKKYPAVILIHGGGWQGGDRKAGAEVALGRALADAGFVAFSVEYRLVKRGPDGAGWVNGYPAAIDDCRAAVRWVRQHAADYGVDAVRLGAAGDSAGGHLVSLLGTTDVAGDLSSRVQAVVDLYGPADLTRDCGDLHLGDIKVQDIVDSFVSTPEQKREASPIFHIDDKSAAFLIFHGSADPLVSVEQSRDFHAALQKAGRQSTYVEFPGAGHGFGGNDAETALVKAIAFFDRELKPEPANAKAAPASSSSTAAPPTDMAAFFKMHYANLVQSFREQNQAYQNVVLVGDSITEGFSVAKYFPSRRVLNRGIGADVIGNALPDDDKRGVLRRMNESIFDCAATDVFLMIGINDLGSGRTPAVMEEGYREILQEVKSQSPRIHVHVESLLPCRDKYAKHNANVNDFNARLKKLADEFGYDYVDVHSLAIDDKGELKAEFTADGLHLNEAGYAPWKVEIDRIMHW